MQMPASSADWMSWVSASASADVGAGGGATGGDGEDDNGDPEKRELSSEERLVDIAGGWVSQERKSVKHWLSDCRPTVERKHSTLGASPLRRLKSPGGRLKRHVTRYQPIDPLYLLDFLCSSSFRQPHTHIHTHSLSLSRPIRIPSTTRRCPPPSAVLPLGRRV